MFSSCFVTNFRHENLKCQKYKKFTQASLNPNKVTVTGKSLSEAPIFPSTNPKGDDRLLIELQVQYMKIPGSEHGENLLCTEIFF